MTTERRQHKAAADRKGLFWPWFVGALLVATVGGQGIMYYAATHDPTFAIEPDYYAKAVAWDSTMARERASAALGWRAWVTIARGPAGRPRLSVRVADSTGVPVTGANVRAVLISNLDAAHPLAVDLPDSARGQYEADLDRPHVGLWEVRLDVRTAGADFSPTLHTEFKP